MNNNDSYSQNRVPGPYLTEEESHQQGRQKRLIRWQLQREAQALLPDERVAFCMRRLQGSMVDVLYSSQHQSAHYKGLMLCGSVWVCPLCAAKISERRRSELEQAIAYCIANGGTVYLATYTVAHKQHDKLSEILEKFLSARKRAKQGSTAQKLKKKFGILGTVSVREVTWSEQNGWHPHCHELIFFPHEIDTEAYAEAACKLWQRSAEHEGLSTNEHGFQLDRTFGAVADYVAKFGREPLREPWGAAAELTKSHLKRGRGNEHLTPFAMLELISLGHDELEPIFREYALWFKGKHQLVWSAGLRSQLLGNSVGKSDLEIASDLKIAQEQELEEEIVLLGQLSRHQWSIILKKEVRGEILEVAKSGNWQDVADFLVHIGANKEPDLPFLGILTQTVSIDLEEMKEFPEITKSTEPTDNSAQLIQDRANQLPDLFNDFDQRVNQLPSLFNSHDQMMCHNYCSFLMPTPYRSWCFVIDVRLRTWSLPQAQSIRVRVRVRWRAGRETTPALHNQARESFFPSFLPSYPLEVLTFLFCLSFAATLRRCETSLLFTPRSFVTQGWCTTFLPFMPTCFVALGRFETPLLFSSAFMHTSPLPTLRSGWLGKCVKKVSLLDICSVYVVEDDVVVFHETDLS